MAVSISAEDRDAIYDVLARYVWAMDTGNIEGAVSVFTADGEVKDFTGRRWTAPDGPRGFASHFLKPGQRGGQHWVKHLWAEPAGPDAWRVTSYWFGAHSRDGRAFIQGLGRYIDTCVRTPEGWRIREKFIDPWNSETSPPLAEAK